MSLLEDNLRLGLQAVKYAKENIGRSGNQHYYKTTSPFREKRVNRFLLSATRTGNYRPTTDENGVFGYGKDDQMAQRRNQLEQLIATPMERKEKYRRIDALMKAWGKDYFLPGQMLTRGPAGYQTRFELLSPTEKVWKIAKVVNKTEREIQDTVINGDEAQFAFILQVFETKITSDNAKKFGVGNCQEKAELAALFLLDQSPGGLRLSLFALDDEHKGLTGLVTRSGGDHAFAVYGHDTIANNVNSLGPNAIIVDGWMNDAYPAQKFLTMKYGVNYNNSRINIKQFTTRNMICVSYRSHIHCFRDFGILGAGKNVLPVPAIHNKNV